MTMRTQRRNGRRGFTLLEVLMVIVILGILVAVIAPQFMGAGEGAKKDLTKSQIEAIGNQLELFRTQCGRYPNTDEGLKALLVKPDEEDIAAKWSGPYWKKEFKDAWNRELQYESPGNVNSASFDLSSPGPDGVPGNDDDITNWVKSG